MGRRSDLFPCPAFGIGRRCDLRDSEEHFTFTETARPSKGRHAPQVFNGRYITVTCGEKGRLSINLKATYINEDFVVKEFTKNISDELSQALDGLVEK